VPQVTASRPTPVVSGAPRLTNRTGSPSPSRDRLFHCLKALGRCPCNVFLVFETGVHQDAQNLDMVFGFNSLSLDGEVLRESLKERLTGRDEVGQLLKPRKQPSYTSPPRLTNRLNTFPVALRTWSGHPRGKIIYERNRTSLAVDLTYGQLSETHSLPQAGLPQGSPLSPILFLFFNADLVQRQINGSDSCPLI
jgi:hypothetical protein